MGQMGEPVQHMDQYGCGWTDAELAAIHPHTPEWVALGMWTPAHLRARALWAQRAERRRADVVRWVACPLHGHAPCWCAARGSQAWLQGVYQ